MFRGTLMPVGIHRAGTGPTWATRLHREAWGSTLNNIGTSFLGCQNQVPQTGGPGIREIDPLTAWRSGV